MLLRPLPLKDVDRLATVALNSRKLNVTGAQPDFTTYARWKEHGRPFVGEAAVLAAIGIAIGMAAALGLTRVMRTLLYGVSATDPWVYGATSAVLLGIAIVAALVPAWRAARVDPLQALRQE